MEFTSFTPEADLLVIQENGKGNLRHEIKLAPFDFDKIIQPFGKQGEEPVNTNEAARRPDSLDPNTTSRIIYEPAADGYKDWNDQLLDQGRPIEEKRDELQEISGKATLNRALAALPEVNPEHIRTGTYDEADYKAVRQRIERADKIIFSFETQDQGMPEKGFQEMYKIREELFRLEKEISDSLPEIKEENQPRFHR